MRWISTLACMTWSLVCFVKADLPPSVAESLEAVNVSWDTPGGEMGSMPIGNGDVAGNVWVDTNGDLVFYIAKSDAWNEQGRLLKLGRVRVKFEPALPVTKFRQTLDLRHGEVVIEGGEGDAATKLRVWADANQPVIRVACESKIPRPALCEVNYGGRRTSLTSWGRRSNRCRRNIPKAVLQSAVSR